MCRRHRTDPSVGEPGITHPQPAQLLEGTTGPFTPAGLPSATAEPRYTDQLRSMLVDRELGTRRRSVDIGGLALALGAVSLGEEGMGKGWGGWEESDREETHYAELLSDMYTQTQSAVNVTVPAPPPDLADEARRRLILSLDSWHFEPHRLPDEEILACTQILFEVLFRVEGMTEAVGVSLAQMSGFVLHLRQAYRSSNSYHNFQHALDVFQATYMYLQKAGAVPSVSILLTDDLAWRPPPIRNAVVGILRNEDLFALCIAAIGHDVGHPGFNNMFMKNAQAPLSQVYDHKSALEQMHCAFLLPIMKRHGLEHLLDRGSAGVQFRKLLLETVLATDMGVHKLFMERFKSLIEQPRLFDVAQARILVCQALIKCADISNPSRPHTVSQHWSAALAAEWASQALLERQLRLPVSVQDSDDPVTEAKGQISFIQAFCLPLLEITSVAIPEMKVFAQQCAANCALWGKRLVELTTQEEPNYPPVPYRSISPQQPHDYQSVFPLSLPANFISPSDVRLLRLAAGGLGSSSSKSESVSESSVTTPFDGSRAPSPYTQVNRFTPVARQGPLPAISTKPLPAFTPVFSPVDISSAASSASSMSPRSEYAPGTPGSDSALVSGPVSEPSTRVGAGTNGVQEPILRIREAYKLSVRKKKSFHRNSWAPTQSSQMPPLPGAAGTPTPTPLSPGVVGLRNLFEQPGPEPPTPSFAVGTHGVHANGVCAPAALNTPEVATQMQL